jgi:hypothetical protein
MAKKKTKSTKARAAKNSSAKGITFGLAIIALILNVIFVSGLGTLVAGRSKTGAWQIALWVIGAIIVSVAWIYETPLIYVGSLLMIAAWIWGLVTGIKLIQEAK